MRIKPDNWQHSNLLFTFHFWIGNAKFLNKTSFFLWNTSRHDNHTDIKVIKTEHGETIKQTIKWTTDNYSKPLGHTIRQCRARLFFPHFEINLLRFGTKKINNRIMEWINIKQNRPLMISRSVCPLKPKTKRKTLLFGQRQSNYWLYKAQLFARKYWGSFTINCINKT